MKKAITIGAALVALSAFSAVAEQSATFRDQFGRTVGQSRTDGNGSEHFSDAFGRSTGTARPDADGATRFYDEYGRFTGSATNNSQRGKTQ